MNTITQIWHKITADMRLRRVPAGQYVVREDTFPTSVFFLNKGTVKMGDVDERGNEKILHLWRYPAILPLAFFSGSGETTKWYYAALTDCELYVASSEELRESLRSNGELALTLMGWFSQEAHELLVRLSSMENSTVRDKVMAALRFLSKYHSQPLRRGWRRVDFPLSHQLLASLTGVRRESVTMQLGRLQQEGIVSLKEFATLDINKSMLTG